MTRSRFVLVCTAALTFACSATPSTADTGGSGGDAAMPTDAGRDAAAMIDVGPADDTGPVVCAADYAGCATLVDHTADTTVSVAITGFAYTPNCIRIHTGTMVTLPGASLHPLIGATCNPPGSPIPTTPSAAGGTFTFTTAGLYGYHCNVHGQDNGTGMAGLIVVE
jgi:plastocyanin